jgi:hypothetical protein
MPRVIGGALLAAAAIVNGNLEPSAALSGMVKGVLVGSAAAAALGVVRAGSEARMEIAVEEDRLRLGARGRCVELALRDIEAVDYDPPFSSARRWLPALVLIDRRDRRWRIPAAVEDGASMMDEIVERSGQDRLRAWADARRVDRRMARSRWFTVAGYGVAAGLVVAAMVFAWF